MEWVNSVLHFFQEGFYGVNVAQGLIISLIAAYMLSDWRRILVVSFFAVVAHFTVDVMLPVFRGHAFRLPPLVEVDFWWNFLRLWAGYLIVINVFYAVKRALGLGN